MASPIFSSATTYFQVIAYFSFRLSSTPKLEAELVDLHKISLLSRSNPRVFGTSEGLFAQLSGLCFVNVFSNFSLWKMLMCLGHAETYYYNLQEL